jgi:hypothetical protein
MSELYQEKMNREKLLAAVVGIIAGARPGRPIEALLAEQIADAFENGIRVGLNLRCNEVVLDVPKIKSDHDVLNIIRHTDGCLIEAQQVCHNVIPGIIELPDAIADYGHKSFAAGFDKGYEEGLTDGHAARDDEEETA